MSNDLLRLIKRAAKEVIADAKPANMCVAQVESVSPIRIRINQLITLGESSFYKTQILDSLAEGDNVVLLSAAGGQKYIVLDVIV